MRIHFSLALLVLASMLSAPARAYTPDEKVVDQDSINALEAKVLQAQPKEQCFLYAELIHQMTEFSVKQYAAGNVDKASDLLKHIQQIAHRVHLSVADDNKRLKNAEILLRHTAFRLTEMLHSSSYEDRELVEQTLAQVNQAESEAMLQVFKK
ncbi:MAG TPA: hypothetical protein VK720_07775 [Terracidiphilus sp.]|jgi:hypothetical protein|nr:hypothetical protein [Terracidiphilus sp.]